MPETSPDVTTGTYTPDQLARMRFELLQATMPGLASKAATYLFPLLTEAQRKDPALAAAIMADKLARSALYVFTTPPKTAKDQNGKAAGTW